LCDRALQLGAAEGLARIDRDSIQRAWSDLQQLPTPWDAAVTRPAAPAVSQVVEFAGLQSDLSTEPPAEADGLADIEPTELDFEDDRVPLGDAVADRPAAAAASEMADPFAEEFAEEEVVLDHFAAWDDLFRRHLPRVENRRDPGFAALVQTAVDASLVLDVLSTDGEPAGLPRRDKPGGSPDQASETEPPVEAFEDDGSSWPPLRLAVVSDPAPLQPIPLLAPSAQVGTVGAAAFESVAAFGLKKAARQARSTESPVLVIEEDAPPRRTNPPVRREEYRHLFSRLRSG
jgi:hypothetical protein